MIKALTTLGEQEMVGVSRLAYTCRQIDKIEFDLQTDKSLNYYKELKSWFLAYEGAELVGVLSIFEPLKSEAEITGCVHPSYREKGIFTELCNAAKSELLSLGIHHMLFSVAGNSGPANQMIHKWNCTLKQSEYSMALPPDRRLQLPAHKIRVGRLGPELLDDMANISSAAFHETVDQAISMLAGSLSAIGRELYGAFAGDKLLGIVSVRIDEETAMINGFAVQPEYQGQGIGKDFMLQLIQMLRERGLAVRLDVDSENRPAYILYRDLGFEEISIHDYYESEI